MTTIWDQAGYITIPVTQEHIDQSMARNSSHCMTALAIQKAIPDARHICVDLQTIRLDQKGPALCLSDAARRAGPHQVG